LHYATGLIGLTLIDHRTAHCCCATFLSIVLVTVQLTAGLILLARQIAALADAAGKWCAIGSWAELGAATMANAHLVASSSNFPFASDTHYPLQEFDVLTEPVEMGNGFIEVTDAPGLGVEVDREAVNRLANIQVRESVFYDDIQGEAPRVGQIL
jgi:L-alanine-DL-glutamate epimerase-like enolase superfamily enzyme